MFDIKEMDSELSGKLCTKTGFDLYRLVDSDTKIVYDYRDGKLVETGNRCYDIWKRGGVCMNCSTSRAAESGKTVVKMEFFEGKILLILSVPVEIGGRKMVAELVNDVSDSMIVYTDNHNQSNEIMQLIDGFNDKLARDSFSGLYSKRYAEDRLRQELEEQNQSHLAAALIDIDHFKSINDRYGHIAGDDVILYLANFFKDAMRDRNEWASRIGGDEFLILFEDLTEEIVRKKCDRFEKLVAEKRFVKDDREFGITVSIGVAVSRPEDDYRSFLDRVDQSMYLEKREKKMREKKEE